MGSIVHLGRSKPVDELAERIARVCRNRLLEPGSVGVPFAYIAHHLGTDTDEVEKGLAWLQRSARVEIRPFRLRTRPYVVIPAVCRIDDVAAG